MSDQELRWFEYDQNNSGGAFAGPALEVWVQARSAEEADRLAESVAGLYFDGCDTGEDCPCCGDRWCRADGKGEDEPFVMYPGREDLGTFSEWNMDHARELGVPPALLVVTSGGKPVKMPVWGGGGIIRGESMADKRLTPDQLRDLAVLLDEWDRRGSRYDGYAASKVSRGSRAEESFAEMLLWVATQREEGNEWL